MAVYTALDRESLVRWLASHDVGTLVDCQGIESGIENSNFFVTTQDGPNRRRFVLTLFERLGMDELPYYLSLMEHLSARRVPCPAPMPDAGGALCTLLAGKPAALVTRLDGRSIVDPLPAHCTALGDVLARLHVAGADFPDRRVNPRGLDWWLTTASGVRGFLDDGQRALLDDEIALQADHWPRATRALPRGPIHADLFRDNALFVEADEAIVLGGIIDFYFAGNDILLFDVAVCINDWCIDPDSGAIDADRLDAFVAAYERGRPLSTAEKDALPLVLRAAALRFWLSRVDDLHRPRPAQMLIPHDPTHFERVLRHRRDDARAASTTSHR